jgi:hypothetical protein
VSAGLITNEKQVRLLGRNDLESSFAIARFADNFHVGFPFQQQFQSSADNTMIFNDPNSNGSRRNHNNISPRDSQPDRAFRSLQCFLERRKPFMELDNLQILPNLESSWGMRAERR